MQTADLPLITQGRLFCKGRFDSKEYTRINNTTAARAIIAGIARLTAGWDIVLRIIPSSPAASDCDANCPDDLPVMLGVCGVLGRLCQRI